jgi:hypothetical protein
MTAAWIAPTAGEIRRQAAPDRGISAPKRSPG